MSTTVLGALGVAAVLGVTHAIEPDHVAGIASLTGQYGDSRLSALVGACFSAGHVLLVVAWLLLGYVLLGRTGFPAVFDVVGTVGVGVLLGLLGALLVYRGFRRLLYVHSHAHEHGGEHHRHVHAHRSLGDHDHDATHDHDHDLRAYLRTGVVGALFTLSPPLSMIAFSATLFPVYGPDVVALAVLAYAVAITATMSTLGAGVGTVVDRLAARPRLHAGAQVLAGAVVVGLGATLLLGSVA